MKRRIAIIGGGVAGIAAAVRLIEADCAPILIESSPRLGGRATSYEDERGGLLLDNGQHVILGCCTNIIDLYDRLDVLHHIRWHRKLYWTRGRGVIDAMAPGWLPVPLHFARALRRMKTFTRDEKRQISRGMRGLVRLGIAGRLHWRTTTFAEYLRNAGQSDTVINSFWNTIIVGACNVPVDRVQASVAMKVIQEGFLSHRWSSTMGLPCVPLVEMYETAVSVIEQGGGKVHLGEPARGIAYDGTRVTGVVTAQGNVDAAAVISAVPFNRLDALVGDTLRRADTRLQQLDQLQVSPILSVHMLFDQRIMNLPHLVLVDRPTHWLFNQGTDEKDRQLVQAVISAADEWMELSEDEITGRVLEDIHHVLPAARGIEPTYVRAIKEKRATFSPTPGSDEFRPAAAPGTIGLGGGGVRNLFLAGDWCDTGWPSTMESAARSGYAAAAAVIGQGGIIEDVPTAWLSRRLGLK